MEVEKDKWFYWHFHNARQIIFKQAGLFWLEGPRGWFISVAQRHELHPVIEYIVKEGVRPKDWHQLLLEWPAVSTEDETQIAYTRDEEKGKADVRTRTSVGKYLSRHWPHVPDHIRRDWAGRFMPAVYKLEHTKEAIIAGIELGPRSCMQSGHGSIPFTCDDKETLLAFMGAKEGVGADNDAVPWNMHPYAVYAPKYGWGMATRSDPGQPNIVLGRALVLDAVIHDVQHKGFVRSYSRNPNGDDANSGSDEKLETWLRDKGFEYWDSWPDGAKLAKLPHPEGHGNFMVPYIDGDVQHVSDEGEYLVIDGDGKFDCTNTDGTYDGCDAAVVGDCARCGDDVTEDDEDRIWAGRDEDVLVCGCCSRNYTYVTGAGRHGGTYQYFVRDSSVVTVNGTQYDEDNLPEDIVLCADAEYRNIDSTVLIDDEYYDIESDEIVCCEDGEWRLKDNCWSCPITGEWYPDDEGYIEVNGVAYSEEGLQKAINEYQGD